MVIKNKNQWKVSEDFNKQRLDYWLKKKISTVPYPTICQLIRKGVIKLNGKKTKNSSILSTGDLINFSRDIKEDGINKAAVSYNQKFSEFIQNCVIFKNDHSIIINKPAGLAVQGGTNIKLNVDLLLDSLRFGNSERPKLVHRIDKQTSGILLIARTLNSSKYYAELFKNRMIEKKYFVIVHGVPKYEYGKIMLKIGEKKKLESLTFFKILSKSKNYSFLVVQPITGRKHQIRNHLNSIGNPIVGDLKFDYKKTNSTLFSSNLYLHAYSLKFKEKNGQIREFHALPPDYFSTTINKMELKLSLINRKLGFENKKKYKLIE